MLIEIAAAVRSSSAHQHAAGVLLLCRGGGGGGATPAVPRRLLRALSERLQPGMSAEDHLTLSPWEKFKQHRCGGQGV
eukprot:COSAG01_NODE_27525_length_683_cov_2.381849_2_plen_77_part_01